MSEIVHGDCLEVMRGYPDNHFTGIVCDPPYGLGFMGKKWDAGLPPNEIWQEALRVIKPGGHLLAFGGTRTYHRLTCAIEDAGWEIRDCVMWLYGSGFPKSNNRFGLEGYGTALKPAHEPCVLAMKPIDGTYAQNVEKWGLGGINIDACRVETEETWEISPRNTEPTGRCLRKEIGTFGGSTHEKGRWPANLILDEEAGAQLDEQSGVLKTGGGNRENKTQNGGYGGGFKPMYNYIAASAGGGSRFFYCAKASSRERNEGCGELFWLDNLELVLYNGTNFTQEELWVLGGQNQSMDMGAEVSQKKDTFGDMSQEQIDKGCCIISFGNKIEDQFPRAIKFTTSTGTKRTIELKTLNYYQHLSTKDCILDVTKTNTDNGISLAENVGLKNILSLIFTKEKTEYLLGAKNVVLPTQYITSVKEKLRLSNVHSTVKPLSLMRYLITLIAPPANALILDPFAGSGSTVVAAHQLGIRAIGIEKEAKYVEIARARLRHVEKQSGEDLFGHTH